MNQQPLSDGSILMRATEEDDAEGFVHAVWLFPGVGLMFIDIRSAHWPNKDLTVPNGGLVKGAFLLNYSVSGSCKVLLDNNSYVLQKQGDLSVSGHFAKEDYFYPEGYYQGLEFLVDPAQAERSIGASAPGGIPDWFGLDFAALLQRYDIPGQTKIGACPASLRDTLSTLWAMYPFGLEDPALPLETLAAMRGETLRVFQKLQLEPANLSGSRRPTFKPQQMRVAEQAMTLLREDLRRDWTLPELAEAIGISESSLKRYFQQLYGCSVAKYQRNARMERAAELLRSPEHRALSILDVALEVGYENQSKFAAAFKRMFGESPLEYKKNAIL